MPAHGDRENFIPFRRADLVERCATEGRLEPGDADRFRSLARLVEALYHHEFHERLERLKDAFAPFDPDADVRPLGKSRESAAADLGPLVEDLEAVLVRANYRKITQEDLERALARKSLIALDLSVDFDDFEDMLLFRRGEGKETVELRKGIPPFRKTVKRQMTVYDRVVLLLRYRDAAHFERRGRNVEKLPFTPGRLYVQLFKDIPRADLEFLFPNMRAGLNLRQKLFIMVPAVGAGIPVLIKVALTLGALIAGIGIFLGLEDSHDPKKLAGAVAGLSALAALGGYLFKQYAKYRSTLTRFLKGITEQLFFKNIDSNAGVFRTVVDEAEEEEGKEAILAYYHLLTGGPASEEELDRRIEGWFETKLKAKLDFEVDDAVAKLETLGLVEREGETVRAVPLGEALRTVDAIWDGLYSFD
jgi:hypothetical protein